jgi:nucleoside-diphosphate-sugar epimerase
MRVFVTGATGYLGRALVRALRAAGHQAVGLARSRTKTVMPGGGAVEWVFGDIREPGSYERAAAGCEAAVHMAAEHGPETATLDLLAVETLLGAAPAHDGRRTLVYTSGLWVLGETGERAADESSPTDHPAQAVAWRPAHERHVLDARGDDLVTAVVRPGMVFGRRGGLFDRFFAEAKAEGLATVVGDGANRWSTVHVDDVAALYVTLVEKAHTAVRALPPRERVFHAMSGTSERVADIAEAASRAAGGSGIRRQPVAEARASLGPMADALVMDQVVRAPRTERVLGFRPSVPGFVPHAAEAFREYASA